MPGEHDEFFSSSRERHIDADVADRAVGAARICLASTRRINGNFFEVRRSEQFATGAADMSPIPRRFA